MGLDAVDFSLGVRGVENVNVKLNSRLCEVSDHAYLLLSVANPVRKIPAGDIALENGFGEFEMFFNRMG